MIYIPKLKLGIAVVPKPKEGIAVVKPPPNNGIAVVAKIIIETRFRFFF